MKRIIGIVLCICVLAYSAYGAMETSSSSGIITADLEMGTNSIDGDSSAGLKFDPDNDGTDEITFAIDGSIAAFESITLDTTATRVLTAEECKGGIRVNSDDDVIDYTLPNAEAGLSVVIQSMFAQVVTIDCFDTNESIVLNGTTLTAGNAIDSPGTKGDYILLVAFSATQWVVMGRSGAWVDGGTD